MVIDRAKLIGRNIARAREAAGMSQADLARAIGVKSQNTIAAIETGRTQRTRHLPQIAAALNVAMSKLDPDFSGMESLRLPPLMHGDADLPVYPCINADDGEITVSTDPIDMTHRPASLANVRDAYSVLVRGDSMEPAARPGDLALINPHLPPRVGDLCLFFSELGDRNLRATLKEYCGETDTQWHVRRYRPKVRDYRIDKSAMPNCHVVISINRR